MGQSAIKVVSKFMAADNLTVGYQRHAIDYWTGLANSRWAPTWQEFSLADLDNEAIPQTSVTDIQAEPFTSTYRYWGSHLTQVFGQDYTGKTPADVPPRSLGVSQSGGCGTLLRERAPHLEVKEFVSAKGIFGRAAVLRLPCSNDGKTVSNGINIYYFDRLGGDGPLSAFFDEVFSKL